MKRSAKPPPEPPPARVRRSAEDSRTAILDATERRLVASGPAGVRLQEVAADVGIAHTTILHHFGSREQLVDEVVRRRIDAMNGEVLGAMRGGVFDGGLIAPVMERLFEAFGPGGHARVVAFLALEGQRNPSLDGMRSLSRVLHAVRVAGLGTAGASATPSEEDTEFFVLLTAFALFGESIVGPLFRGEDPAAPDPEARARFLRLLTRLVESLLVPPAATSPPVKPAVSPSAAVAGKPRRTRKGSIKPGG